MAKAQWRLMEMEQCEAEVVGKKKCAILDKIIVLEKKEYFIKELEKNQVQHRVNEIILKYKLEGYQKIF